MGSMLIIAYFGPARAVPVKNTGGSRDTHGTHGTHGRTRASAVPVKIDDIEIGSATDEVQVR